ncbi:MAG: helix-turn-helix domain-containing protein, partial [Acidimicrobiia bacterium]
LVYVAVLGGDTCSDGAVGGDGLRNDQIAARLDCGRDVVSQWRKRFFEQRLAGLEDRPRRGRPPTFPPPSRAR